jgi:hypothetical protein
VTQHQGDVDTFMHIAYAAVANGDDLPEHRLMILIHEQHKDVMKVLESLNKNGRTKMAIAREKAVAGVGWGSLFGAVMAITKVIG